jgi:peptidoglycan/LPS O-acetylase OafA/YrhL
VQAWFPAHAEIWNAPTWFLSALTFAMLVLPHVLPAIAAMRKKGLKLLLVCMLALAARVELSHLFCARLSLLLQSFVYSMLHGCAGWCGGVRAQWLLSIGAVADWY